MSKCGREMFWVSVEDALPENGQAVLVRYAKDNWLKRHKLANGATCEIWRWQAAQFVVGLTEIEAEARGYFKAEDQFGNNERPYHWDEFGPGTLFGQDVTHWAAISDPYESDYGEKLKE